MSHMPIVFDRVVYVNVDADLGVFADGGAGRARTFAFAVKRSVCD
jgi:hypothetical protein